MLRAGHGGLPLVEDKRVAICRTAKQVSIDGGGKAVHVFTLAAA